MSIILFRKSDMSLTKLYIHCVFATKNRENLLIEKYDSKIQWYIVNIVKDKKCGILAINNVWNHMHILIKLHPSISISKLMQEIKWWSSKFINENHLSYWRFSRWQWYWCFTCSESQLQATIKYIKNQKEHHKESWKDDTLYSFGL